MKVNYIQLLYLNILEYIGIWPYLAVKNASVCICNFGLEDDESLSGMGLNLAGLLRFPSLTRSKALVESLIKISCRANHSSHHVKQSFEIPKHKATSWSKLHVAKVGAVGF